MYTSEYMKKIPNFKEGMSRVLDLKSSINKNKFMIFYDDDKADLEALKSDWNITGNDMREAINEFRRGYKKNEG